MSIIMDTKNVAFCNVQNQFCNWTRQWLVEGYSDSNIQPDVVEIVTLLQILGYKIRFMDKTNPLNITPLENGAKGVSLHLACGNSGFKAHLESDAMCRCPQNVNEVKQWEVTGSEPKRRKEEIKERGNDLLIAIPDEIQKLVKNLMTHIFRIFIDQANEETNTTASPTKSTAPTIMVHSPEIPMSPARYRSLDTLTKPENISEIPEPGVLKKLSPTPEVPGLHTCSSPSLVGNCKPTQTSSPIKTNEELYNKLLTVKKDIEETIALFLSSDEKVATELNFDVSKIKRSPESLVLPNQQAKRTSPKNPNSRYPSFSNPNLSRSNSINIPRVRSTDVGKPAKPLCRRPIRSCSDNPDATKNDKAPRRSAENISSIPKPTTLKPLPPKPMIKKLDFSHVKSTIPKVSSKKTNVSTNK